MARHIHPKFEPIFLEKTQNLYRAAPPEGPSNQGGPFYQAGPSIGGGFTLIAYYLYYSAELLYSFLVIRNQRYHYYLFPVIEI